MSSNIDSVSETYIDSSQLEKLWDQFLEKWPLERLQAMSLEEYTSQGTDDSFCYWIESATDKLGSIWGGSAFKFGVYARKDRAANENSHGRCYDDHYGWMEKYGSTPQEAFLSVRAEIVKVANAARKGDLETVNNADLGEAISWKIAFLYQNRIEPTVLPIFSGNMLSTLTGRSAKKERLVALDMLITQLGHQNIFEFSHQLLEKANELIAAEFNVDKAMSFLGESEGYQAIKPATKYVAGYESLSGKQIALIRSSKKVSLFLEPGSWLNGVQSQLASVREYSASESRNSNLGANAPLLATGNPAISITVDSLSSLQAVCTAYDSDNTDSPNFNDSDKSIEVRMVSTPNQILYGPPGTGKTYATTEKAVALADPQWLAELNSKNLSDTEKRATIKQHYEELIADKRIAFTTFHQSLSYEDFVEGIRAETNDESKNVEYLIKDGIFKELAERAGKSVASERPIGLSESPTIWKISIGRKHEKEMRDRYIQAGQARIGWNETGDLSLELDERELKQQTYWDSLSYRNHSALNAFSSEIKAGDVLLCLKDAETVQAVGIVTSDYSFDESISNREAGYAHVREVDWLLTDIDLNILPLNNDRRMVQQTVYPLSRINWNSLVEELKRQNISLQFEVDDQDNSKRNYVLIIDEINRGNISRIFGELITLLEPDKRKNGSDERSVTLPYSKDSFSVPDNLYVLGTMNTADKSLAQLDLALRRRFEFIELMPDPDLLAGVSVYGVDISELLKVLNQRIEVLLDRDHTIGHAYFWPLRLTDSEDERQKLLADIFAKRVIPLLQEYFFSDWERISWVLNDIQKSATCRFIELDSVGMSLTDLFPEDIANQITDRRYRINKQSFMEAGAYRGILSGMGE